MCNGGAALGICCFPTKYQISSSDFCIHWNIKGRFIQPKWHMSILQCWNDFPTLVQFLGFTTSATAHGYPWRPLPGELANWGSRNHREAIHETINLTESAWNKKWLNYSRPVKHLESCLSRCPKFVLRWLSCQLPVFRSPLPFAAFRSGWLLGHFLHGLHASAVGGARWGGFIRGWPRYSEMVQLLLHYHISSC